MAKSSRISFLVFSDDWGEHPSSCQHLFQYIGEKYPVLWINTVGMRSPKPTMTDLGKSIKKLRKMIFGAGKNSFHHNKSGNVIVYQPPMVPLPRMPGARVLNRVTVTSGVRKRLYRLGMGSPILVSTVPNACDYVGRCGEQRVVYYCVDDFSAWPGLDHDLVEKMEQKLIGKTDVFVATSHKLYEKLAEHGKPAHLLNHGVDLEFFRKEPDKEHIVLQQIPRPRVGYFGLFDQRSDQNLLSQVAKQMSDVSFVITGRVEIDVGRLKVLPNVFFTGRVPYSELPAVIKGWDACILPYSVNDLSEAITPLKLKEYLASGKPVVSTPIPEATRLVSLVNIAETSERWVEAIRCSLKEQSSEIKNQRRSFLVQESWVQKAAQFLEMCLDFHLKKRPQGARVGKTSGNGEVELGSVVTYCK